MQIRVERIGLVIITVKDKGHFGRAKRIVGIKEKIKTEILLATLKVTLMRVPYMNNP
jgi:hypothetical protein